MIGTVRNQDLIITSNNKKNLVCKGDGSVQVENLIVGTVPMTSASAIPTANMPLGTIVWNDKPEIGKSIGWVSLGGARWAKFGTIE
jgi:hypothetical protein